MKKGFTLIELLAVLVILAIIALIATPIILNIINNAKDSANQRSVEMYAKSIETMIATELLKNPNGIEGIAGTYETTDNKKITSITDPGKEYEIKYGKLEVVCNYVKIRENGTVYIEDCLVGDYTEMKEALKKIVNKDPDAPKLKTYSYGTNEEEYYANYEETAHYQVGDDVVATIYDNAQFGGKAGEYTLVFTGTGATYDYYELDGYPLYSSYKTKITKAEISYGITNIDGWIFVDCINLKEVKIATSVTNIGFRAFEGCTGLISITIPDSVTTIETAAFAECVSLAEITIPRSVIKIENGVFEDTIWYKNQPDGLLYINDVLYKHKGTMLENTSINVKEGIVSISDYALEDEINLINITIPSSVVEIGYHALEGTTWYKNQPDGLVYINDVLYKHKGTMLANTSVEVKEGTKSISDSAFLNQKNLTNISLPNSVTSIGDGAFSGCTGLTSITIPDSVTSIDGGAFSGCTSLTTIALPKNLVIIEDLLFYNCQNLSEINLNENLKIIKRGAFQDCTSLESITIPSSVISIGKNINYEVFGGCTNLKTINYKGTATGAPWGATNAEIITDF